MGPAVSVCHMWSMTGMRSSKTVFWSHSQAGAFRTSPAENNRSRVLEVVPPGELLAVAHQEPDPRRRGEDAGDAFALDDRPHRVGVGVVDRTLVGEGRGTCHQRRVDDVGVADGPADVGRRPPGLALPETEHPIAHRCDVDGKATVGVDGELRLGGRARGGEDERGIGGEGVLGRARLALAGGEEFVPRQFGGGPRVGQNAQRDQPPRKILGTSSQVASIGSGAPTGGRPAAGRARAATRPGTRTCPPPRRPRRCP